MNVFSLEIQSAFSGIERFEDITSFTGLDISGSFGILAFAERRITVLLSGLASFRKSDGVEEFLAHAGGLLYFRNNELLLTTQTYVCSSDYLRIESALETEIKKYEMSLQETRRSMHRLDEEFIKRLSGLNSRGEI